MDNGSSSVGLSQEYKINTFVAQLQGCNDQVRALIDRIRGTNSRLFGETPQEVSGINAAESPPGSIAGVQDELDSLNANINALSSAISQLETI